MKMNHLGLALALAAGLLAAAPGVWGRESAKPPAGEALGAAAAERAGGYVPAVGDRLAVALFLKPPAPAASQTITPGDRLAIAYHFSTPPPDQPYRVAPGDRIYLDFRYSPELSQIYTQPGENKVSILSRGFIVQPGGTVTLVGLSEPLSVLDKTGDEIAKIVAAKYKEKDLLKVPDVGVTIEPQYAYEKTLQALVQPLAASAPPILAVSVPPDGLLSLPLVAGLKTGGKTVQELGKELSGHYAALKFRFLTVSVWFEQVGAGREEQLRAIFGGPAGVLHCEVLAGGQIALPLVAQFSVAGKSLSRIGEGLSARYHEQGCERAEISVWVDEPRRP